MENNRTRVENDDVLVQIEDFLNTDFSAQPYSSQPYIEEVSSIPESVLEQVTSTTSGTTEKEVPLDLRENVSRFKGASWFEKAKSFDITICGVGGINSWTSLLMARLSPTNIYLYDDDIVEEANMSGQLYSINDIDKEKVRALSDTLLLYSRYYANAIIQKVTESTPLKAVTICGFDNMSARKVAFNNWVNKYKGDPNSLFIDGRLNAEELQIYCFTGVDECYIERYSKEALFNDNESISDICSYKQTSHIACMIGSLITNLYTNFCDNLVTSNKRDLPYYVTYNAEMMYLKTSY